MLKQKIMQVLSKEGKRGPQNFREKDLQYLFEECSFKYQQLLKLEEERKLLQDQKESFKPSLAQKVESVEPSKLKPVSEVPPKKKSSEYKIKCGIKSCGKIMFSQASYEIHMKKHAEKKSKKEDPQEHFYSARKYY